VCSGLAFIFCLAGCCLTKGAGGEGQPLPAPPQTVNCEHLKLCFSWIAALLSVLWELFSETGKKKEEKKVFLAKALGPAKALLKTQWGLAAWRGLLQPASGQPTPVQAPFQLLVVAGEKELCLSAEPLKQIKLSRGMGCSLLLNAVNPGKPRAVTSRERDALQ